MAKKKSTTKKAKDVAPKGKKVTKKEKKEKVDKNDDVKGRIVVSQRERDEIDAVIDAFWAFIAAVKRAPKILLLAGIFLTITGATFAGWPQDAFDLEIEGKTGVWVLVTKNDFQMSKNSDGNYANFDVDDRVWLEGELNEIQYYGPIEGRDFPRLGTEGGDPPVAPGDSYKIIEKNEFDVLFSSFGGSNSNLSSINYADGENVRSLIGKEATERKLFSDDTLESALFNDVIFTDVIFSNLTLNDTFFVDCSFERVLFDNVKFNRAVFTNSSFDTIFFNNSNIESSRFDSDKFTHLWVKNSVFSNTVFDKTDIFGSKWSYSSLENGKYQRGEINVVIFRSLDVNNFVLNNAEGGRTVLLTQFLTSFHKLSLV